MDDDRKLERMAGHRKRHRKQKVTSPAPSIAASESTITISSSNTTTSDEIDPARANLISALNLTTRVTAVPCRMGCPSCGMFILTRTKSIAGLMTYASSLGLLVAGGCFGCFLIPFCVDSLKDVKHVCPECNQDIIVYHRL